MKPGFSKKNNSVSPAIGYQFCYNHPLLKSCKTLILLLIILLFANHHSQAQITGRVTDAQSGQPLAFVHVLIKDTRVGTMTDIDGYFSINLPHGKEQLQLSYVGYFAQVYWVDPEQTLQKISLHQQPYLLQEVVVYPGQNPAHRIIRNAIDNRGTNDPENLPSFSYTSYNKLLATLDRDFFFERWEMTRDSTNLRVVNIIDKRHIFLMESVTERKYRAPGQNNETVVANRVSGLQNPMFTMLATELQPFSFYAPAITLLGKEFLSPLNRVAFNRYAYHLKDTLFHLSDTIFVITYHPRPNSNFDGLKGVLYINSNQWAIQNVIAEPAHQVIGGLNFRIQQQYRLIDNLHWFPVQLNTDIDFFNPGAAEPTAMPPMRMIGRSYIEDIDLKTHLRSRDFSMFSVDLTPDANQAPPSMWEKYRVGELSALDEDTYRYMDSLGAINNFDRLLSSFEPIMYGDIPMGIFNVPLNSIYRFNQFEQHRLGLGLNTNNYLSRRFRIGGYYAWGSGDKKSKYRYFGEIILHRNRNFRLGAARSFDVSERGGSNPIQYNFLLSTKLIRNFYMNKMDYWDQSSAYLSFIAFRGFLTAELAAKTGTTSWTDLYNYTLLPYKLMIHDFNFAEATLRLRFAYGETFINTPLRVMRLPSNWPVLYLNVAKGFNNILDGQFDYLRLEARADISYSVPLMGRQSWIIEGGWTNRHDLPWPLLFTAKAGNRNNYLASPFSFGTMDMNEFAASQYAAVYFQHNFLSLLFRRPRYQPELVIIANAGLGSLSHIGNHMNMEARSWDKGYYESGFAINKIFPGHWVRRVIFGMSPGIEVLYRFGPYSLPTPGQNLTIKLSMVSTLM